MGDSKRRKHAMGDRYGQPTPEQAMLTPERLAARDWEELLLEPLDELTLAGLATQVPDELCAGFLKFAAATVPPRDPDALWQYWIDATTACVPVNDWIVAVCGGAVWFGSVRGTLSPEDSPEYPLELTAIRDRAIAIFVKALARYDQRIRNAARR